MAAVKAWALKHFCPQQHIGLWRQIDRLAFLIGHPEDQDLRNLRPHFLLGEVDDADDLF